MEKFNLKFINLVNKVFSPTCLIISILLLVYTFYKSKIYWDSNLDEYYNVYYFFSLILFFFSIISFFISKKIKNYLLLFFIITIIFIYILESLVSYKIYKINNSIKFKNKYESYLEMKKVYSNIVIDMDPKIFLDSNSKFLPLSGISNILTIDCPGQTIWKSDRYGFNNDDKVWDEKTVDFLIIGDSIAQGECVSRSENISSIIQNISKKNVINLGYDGNGPLLEFATLKEYLNPNVKNILWLYNEKNDLDDLKYEIKNKTLINYLKNPFFSQNLKNNQNNVNKLVYSKFEKHLITNLEETKKRDTNYQIDLIKFLKIYSIRYSLNLFYKKINEKIPTEFIDILHQANEYAIRNNSNFYFVYLPEKERYTGLLYASKLNKMKLAIENLNIPFIDLDKLLFNKKKINLFPEELPGNYTAEVYKQISKTIYNFVID